MQAYPYSLQRFLNCHDHSPTHLFMSRSSQMSRSGDRCPIHTPIKAPRWRQLGLTTVALAIALATLGLANCSKVDAQGDPIITAQTPLEEQSRVDDLSPIEAQGRMHPSLILWIEIVVAALLLVGLVATFLAYRGIRQAQSETNEQKNRIPNTFNPQPEPSEFIEDLESLFATEAHLEPESGSSRQLPPPPQVQLSGATLGQLQQQEEAEQEQLATQISLRLRQSQTMENLLRTSVKEVRKVLNADRVIIFGLDSSNWEGLVLAESVAPGWSQILRVRIDDPCFRNNHVELYKNGRVRAVDNIYQEPGLTDCYISMLEQFAVKANLVAPILKNEQLIGLLIAHQCSAPRHWQPSDIDLFKQLAAQVGLATEQVSYLEQQEEEAERVQLVTEISLRLRQCQHMEELLRTAVKEVRRALKTERVLICGLDPTSGEGLIVAESVTPGWPQMLRVKIDDPSLRNGQIEMYKNGQVRAIDNIYQEPGLTEGYIRMHEQFSVKAQLIAPLIKNNQLLGLMIAHQCSEPRRWQQSEIELFTQLSTQVGFITEQVNLSEQMERSQSS